MFERFTDKARKAVMLAMAKATERGDDQVRPAHLLYGLTATDGVAARALTALGVDAAAVERELDRAGGASLGPLSAPDEVADGDTAALAAIGIDLDEIKRRIEESFGPGALERVPLTPRGPLNWTRKLPLDEAFKLSLTLSVREARALRHSYIGTEHLLLGLLRVAERYPHGEFATAILSDLGLDPATARDRVLAELSEMLRGQRPGR
jgi:ATP-dependent Clp protease ATP-binding subunit ClpA